MTKFLLKCFVPEYEDSGKEQVRRAVGALSGMVGICANLLLFLGKMMAALLSGSVSIAADALNNLTDVSGSVLTLVGFRLASKPADAHHPYGHARFEYLSGLAVAAMIMLMGAELVRTSLEKILNPRPVEVSFLTAVILLVSVGVKLWLGLFNKQLGDHIQSPSLQAVSVDSRNDCIATVAVLTAALVENYFHLRVDGIMGLLVAAFIIYSGWNLAKDTISPLLGERATPELRQQIVDYVQSNPMVLGYHDLMVHDYGPGRQYASLHVEMDCREDPLVCHEIIDEMEWKCLQNHGIHLVIHYDPVVTDDPRLTALKKQTQKLLHRRDPRLSLHDFRMVPGRKHMNLVFDVVLPADLEGQKQQILRLVEEGLNRENAMTYHVKITFDMI